MVERITVEQVRAWLDPSVVGEITETSESTTEFNLELEVSRMPLHVIKEERSGPVRIVGKCGFDTERVAALLDDDRRQRELFSQLSPVLVTVPGFYTFMDEEGTRCEFSDLRTIQFEQRRYPDGLSRDRLMGDVIAIAKGMRHVQNVVAVVRETTGDGGGEASGDNGEETAE
ncbi:hypothetical protein [Natronoarchaeum rubrum]|uniref:hypothetical protein n=1 Tax=Natronoarchaeum rubrum TaxID=755311 RepID=UPI002110FF33|nr:hypothetical protein [Natronoarchaeum rubrum]HMB49273.1 hypothetical protein [Natronoarchaeum rubrum]